MTVLPLNMKNYPAYKTSGVEWLSDVPTHWKVRPNRAVFTEVNQRGYPDEQILSVTIGEGVILQQALLQEGHQKDSSRVDKSDYKLVHPCDIVYNKMRAWQGAIGGSKYRGIVSPAYIIQRPNSGVDPLYFHHLFRTPGFAIEAERWSYGIASDMWSLRAEHFKMIHCLLPPLSEQRAIVRYLDYVGKRIRRYIHAKERLIERLAKGRQAVIARAVTKGLDTAAQLKPAGVPWLGDLPAHWQVRRLKTVAELRVSNVDKHTKEGESPVHLCNYVDVYNNDQITQAMAFMSATASEDEIERFRLKQDDVLITKDSEAWDDIGVPALVVESADDLLSGYHLALLRPYAQTLGAYLALALQSKACAYQFHVRASGVTRYGLTRTEIQSILIPLPPLSEQRAIVEHVNRATARIDDAIARARRQVELMQEYRTRLVVDVVTGKLDVREAAAQLPDEANETEGP